MPGARDNETTRALLPSVRIGPESVASKFSSIRKITRAFSSALASEGRKGKPWGEAAPSIRRWGSATPAVTKLTSECSGLIVVTIPSAAAGLQKPTIASAASFPVVFACMVASLQCTGVGREEALMPANLPRRMVLGNVILYQ